MNYNYTEEHYAEMYNNLPEGLKDLVLSGRLALQVSAIGSRHGLNADQVADLEPAIEDVCLGLILKSELAQNIKTQVGTDDRVANRIAAEVEIEILRPFEPELLIARQQKEDLDDRIKNPKKSTPTPATVNPVKIIQEDAVDEGPKNVSEHSNVKAVKDFFNNSSNTKEKEVNFFDGKDLPKKEESNTSFDWDKDFGKAETQQEKQVDIQTNNSGNAVNEKKNTSIEGIGGGVAEKLDKLTESINKLVDIRFGGVDKKDDSLSEQMKSLLQRLENAEKENEENKKLIKKLQGDTPITNIFGDKNKITIDKPRKVDIDKEEVREASGNIQITSVSKNIPIENLTENIDQPKKPELKKENIFASVVSRDTVDTIVETRNKELQNTPVTAPSKSVLTLDELIKKGDDKIKQATTKTATLVFPSVNNDKKIDIKNVSQAESLRNTLLEDIEFLKKTNTKNEKIEVSSDEITKTQANMANQSKTQTTTTTQSDDTQKEEDTDTSSNQSSTVTNPFKDELLPKTKEDRMKALQDKIKAMNKGVSAGGTTNISASGLDPYKL